MRILAPAWYWATPGCRHSSRTKTCSGTPLPRPAAIGSMWTRRPGSSGHGPRWTQCWTSCGPGTRSWCGALIGWAAPLRHLIDIFAELDNRGVGVRSLTESIDTSTPGGKLVFHVFAALAEFERDLIRERTIAGLDAARARGRHGGRPTVWTVEKLRTAMSMYKEGEHDVAPSPGCSASAGPRCTGRWPRHGGLPHRSHEHVHQARPATAVPGFVISKEDSMRLIHRAVEISRTALHQARSWLRRLWDAHRRLLRNNRSYEAAMATAAAQIIIQTSWERFISALIAGCLDVYATVRRVARRDDQPDFYDYGMA